MKKIDAFLCGIASIFTCSNNSYTNILKKYPSTYEKNVQTSLQKSWLKVGKTMEGVIADYGKKAKNN